MVVEVEVIYLFRLRLPPSGHAPDPQERELTSRPQASPGRLCRGGKPARPPMAVGRQGASIAEDVPPFGDHVGYAGEHFILAQDRELDLVQGRNARRRRDLRPQRLLAVLHLKLRSFDAEQVLDEQLRRVRM